MKYFEKRVDESDIYFNYIASNLLKQLFCDICESRLVDGNVSYTVYHIESYSSFAKEKLGFFEGKIYHTKDEAYFELIQHLEKLDKLMAVFL